MIINYLQKAWHHFIHIMYIVQILGQRVIHVNRKDFPVSFTLKDNHQLIKSNSFKKFTNLVNHSEDSQDLDLDNGTPRMDPLTNLAHIDRIVVTLAVGGVVGMVGILETSQFYCLGSNMPHCRDPPPKFAGLLRSSRYIRGAGSSWPQICQYFVNLD